MARRTRRKSGRTLAPPASQQKTFNPELGHLYSRLTEFVRSVARDAPPKRGLDTRDLDKYLADAWHQEPFIAGVVSSIVKLHSSRGWSVTGGRNRVSRFVERLHGVNDGEGWRQLVGELTLSHLTSHVPCVELGRQVSPYIDNRTGLWSLWPVETMWSIDPTVSRVTQDRLMPIEVNGSGLGPHDYFMVSSTPENRMSLHGISTPPLWLCLRFVMFLAALEDHDQGQLDPSFVHGILTVTGTTEEAFAEAFAARKAARNDLSGGTRVPGGAEIAVLISEEVPLDVNFHALSRMPDGFDYEQRVLWAITAISMAFGFPSEEWIGSHASTLLGQSGAEVEAGLRRANAKGEGDFVRKFQEKLAQHVVPDGLHFEFEERDSLSEVGDMELRLAKSSFWRDLFLSERSDGSHLGTPEQFIEAMIKDDVLPSGWNDIMDDQLTYTDVGVPSIDRRRMRDKALSTPAIHRALADMKGAAASEPIVRYEWGDVNDVPFERVNVLWDRAEDAMRPTIWHLSRSLSGVFPDVRRASNGATTSDGNSSQGHEQVHARIEGGQDQGDPGQHGEDGEGGLRQHHGNVEEAAQVSD